MVVMPTQGRGEYGSRKYVVYRRVHGQGAEAEIIGADVLPPHGQFELVKVSGAN